ncbi:NUDIX hydrolase [Pararhizobium haloflavum]|uniref:NUDIX hydrolase n=1 Tax=Pararhizobium haloflavum TaxID=2037914 RepID=UPI000C17C303|nr:NAD regulator [Pararhizobium haloflavum]
MKADAVTIAIGLNAAIIAISGLTPRVLIVDEPGNGSKSDSLPLGPFDPQVHRTFEMGLRASVADQTGLDLGYVEQLYTFGDRGRHERRDDAGLHIVSVGYLALTRIESEADTGGRGWTDWYRYLPWEDWRPGRPALLDRTILPRLAAWVNGPPAAGKAPSALSRRSRVRLAFGLDDFPWDEERVLERYELLYEAGLVEEAVADGRIVQTSLPQPLGRSMAFDHRRILATAVSRLRGKIKYRPVIFELMPPRFTLTELQATVEAISGRHVHKQNFRRLVEGAELVEPTGESSARTGGRPAALYRFRRAILEERPAPGLKLGGRNV